VLLKDKEIMSYTTVSLGGGGGGTGWAGCIHATIFSDSDSASGLLDDEYLISASDWNTVSVSTIPTKIECKFCSSPNDIERCMCSQCGAPLPIKEVQ